MFDQEEKQEHNFWISYADLTSGFLIVFMVLTFILYNRNEADSKLKGMYSTITDKIKEGLADNPNIDVREEGVVRFFTDTIGNELFAQASFQIEPYFSNLLEDFYPVYIEQIKSISENPDFEIKEIRIEGHADKSGLNKQELARRGLRINCLDSYTCNLFLSSNRALSVYDHFLNSNQFNSLSPAIQEMIRQKTISCGYSFSKPLNEYGELLSGSSANYSSRMSRRVEFRILIEYLPVKN